MTQQVDDVGRLFDELAAGFLTRPGVQFGRIFHNEGLTVNGKIFAMPVRGRLVVKLTASRAADLVEGGQASRFEPRPGRPMREWVMLDPPPAGDTDGWRVLMEEAFEYVSRLSQRRSAPRSH